MRALGIRAGDAGKSLKFEGNHVWGRSFVGAKVYSFNCFLTEVSWEPLLSTNPKGTEGSRILGASCPEYGRVQTTQKTHVWQMHPVCQ